MIVLQRAFLEVDSARGGEGAPPRSCVGNYTQHPGVKPQSSERCLRASVLYSDVVRASVSKVCPKASKEPKTVCKGVTVNVKLDIIKHFYCDKINTLCVR